MAQTKALTNEGRNAVRDFLQSDLDDMAIGTDSTDASKTDTSLGNEVIRKAISDEDDAGTGATREEMRLLTTEANGNALKELGLFTGAGSMYARIVFAEINKTNSFEVQFEVTATVRNP